MEELGSVVELKELRDLQKQIKLIYVDETMKRYIVELAHQTRNHKDVYLGVSPRGSIALMKAAQAYAFAYGREYVLPDDIQSLIQAVFAHRIILKSDPKFAGVSAEEIVGRIMEHVPVPVQRVVR